MTPKTVTPRAQTSSSVVSTQDRQTQAKILQRVLLITIVVCEMTMVQYFVIWLQTQVWQSVFFVFALAAYCVVLFTGLRWIRGGRQELAARAFIIGIMVFPVVAPFLVRTAGVIVCIVVLIINITLSVQTLPSQELRWVLSASILVTAWAITVDLLAFPTQLVLPIIEALAVYLGGAVIIVGVFTIFRQFRLFSLENKIALSFLVVALIPVGGLASLNAVSSRNTLISLTNQTLLNTGLQTAQVIDNFYSQNVKLIQVQAQIEELRDYLTLPANERASSPLKTSLNTLLQNYKKLDSHILSYGVIDAQGTIVLSTEAIEIGEQLTDATATLAAAEGVTTPVRFIGANPPQPYLQFSAPVKSVDNQQLGGLYVRYKASILQDFIAQSAGRAGADSFAILLDENYLQLANGAEPEAVFKSLTPLSAERLAQLQADQRLPPNVNATELSMNLAEFETALNQLDPVQPFFTTQLTTTAAVTNTALNAAAVVNLTQQPWHLVFLQPQGSFLGTVETQTRIVLLVALGITALVAIAGIALARLLANPIVRLTTVAQQIAGGDLNAQADVSLGDEIGVLARSFNDMTSQLTHTLKDLDERAKALTTNTEVGQKISTILEEQQLVQAVVNQIQTAFNYYYVQIYLLAQDGKTLRLASGSGEVGETLRARGHALQMGRGLVGRAAQSNEAVIVPNTTLDANWLPNPLLPETKSEVAVPIAIGERVLGVLDVQHSVPDSLKAEVADLLRSLATQVAIALQNAWAYADSQNLYSLSTKIAAADSLQQVLTALAEAFPLPVINRMVLLQYLTNEQGVAESAIVAGTWHNGQGQVPEPVGARYPPALFKALGPLLGATPTMITDVLSEISLLAEAYAVAEHLNLHGFAGLPLYVGPRQIGILLLQCETPHAFSEEELQPYLAAAGPIAIAMDNQRLLAQAQDRLQRERVLREVTTQVRSALDVETVLQRTAQEVGRALGRRVFVRLGTTSTTSHKPQ